jgi:NAD(P)-dependent dehydrogenase (short-subunit alcohol dehydrogenase family)
MTAEPGAGQRVLVTGAADGIGLVIASQFLAHGAQVHICDVDREAVRRVLEAEPRFLGTVADVGDSAQVRRLFQDVADWLGDVNVLVNNVGIPGPKAWTEDMSEADWESTIAVNLHGAFYCIKQALPAMKERRNGVIINISTVSVRTLPLKRSVYNVSKAAVEALTLNVAKEAGRFNIRCNAIRPGIVNNARGTRNRTRLAKETGRTLEAVEQEYLQFVSMRTKIEQEEVADMARFLASDGAKHVTGQIISVDGNMEYEGLREIHE